MRIEAYTQVQQMYNTKQIKKSKQAETSKFSDQFEISKAGKEMQVAKQAVASAPDIRKELVDPIKNRVQNGTYEVASESFAEKVVQKYEESQML